MTKTYIVSAEVEGLGKVYLARRQNLDRPLLRDSVTRDAHLAHKWDTTTDDEIINRQTHDEDQTDQRPALLRGEFHAVPFGLQCVLRSFTGLRRQKR